MNFFETVGGVILCAAIFIASIIVAGTFAAEYAGKGGVDKMKACVASGQQWKYNRDGNTHECVK